MMMNSIMKQQKQHNEMLTTEPKEYGDAIYSRLEYLLNEIRSNIEINSKKELLFNNENELKNYSNKLRLDITHRLNKKNYEILFNQIKIYENQYLKLLKIKADYEALCERFIDLLTSYQNLNKTKSETGIVNLQQYFNNMLVNFELLRRSLANKKIKYEKLVLKQQRMLVNEHGELYFEDIFNGLDDNHDVKSFVSDKKLEIFKIFDFKTFKLTYNQLQHVREVCIDDGTDFFVCCKPYYFSELGFIIEKFNKNTRMLLCSVEIERKFTFRNVIFGKNLIFLWLKTPLQLFSYLIKTYDLELNLVDTLKFNFNTNILAVNLCGEKFYVFTEFSVYIYSQHDLSKEICSFKLDYENYTSFKLSFIDDEFYRANIFVVNHNDDDDDDDKMLIYYQDNSYNLNILRLNDKKIEFFKNIDLLKLKNYELIFIDHLSKLYFLNFKQKSLIICYFETKFEILDEFNLDKIENISSVYVTKENYLVVSDFIRCRIYFYKI
jgi:hypothetical protein